MTEKELKEMFKKKYKYTYYRSPLRYKGNKYSLLPILLPIFNLSKKDTFIDCFGGSGTISINVRKNLNFKEVIYNELDKKVFNIIKTLNKEDVLDELLEIQERYLPNKIKHYYGSNYKNLSIELLEKIKMG